MLVASPALSWIAQRWSSYFEGLRFFAENIGERLVIVILPDEFQVNDTLWEQVQRKVGDASPLERDLPQKKILAFCAEHGIPCLDLLPILRAAEREGHTYHLRDTHWNARGNEVAGRATSDFLLEQPAVNGSQYTSAP